MRGGTFPQQKQFRYPNDMGQVNRFKYIRARYTPNPAYGPGYFNYGLYKMRQLPSQFFNGTIFTPPFTYAQCIIPKGSWGFNKALIIRYAWQLLWNSTPPAPGMQLQELINFPTIGSVLVPGASGTPAAVPVQSGIGERVCIRLNNSIWMADMPYAEYLGRMWDNGGNELVINGAPSLPDSWFASEQIIKFQVSDSTDSGIFSLNMLWVEAFLEQGTNLGALT